MMNMFLGYFMDNELPFYKEQLFECLTYLEDDDPQYLEAENYMINAFGPNWNINQITQAHEDVYKGHVAETYYSIVTQAIKAADPNHLLLGTRINASAKYTPSIIEAAGNHSDILTINYYKVWEPEDEAIELYDDLTDIPWMVTEFYTKGDDVNLSNAGGAGWVVPTQEDRAIYFENFVLKLMTDPNCVGYHWFRYRDDDSNKGLFDVNYNLYQPLVESLTQLNEAKYSLRDHQLSGVINHECDCMYATEVTVNSETCDDGNPCTSGETYDSNCNCSGGTLNDADGDGVCDDFDTCPGFDDSQDADNDGIPDGCDSCPENLIDLASQNITNGAQVSNYIKTNGFVQSGSDVLYIAGNYIEMYEGFEVEFGGIYEALIEDCQ